MTTGATASTTIGSPRRPYRIRSMHGHARADGVGLELLVDREGWTRLALVRLAGGRLTGLEARIDRGTAALIRARVEAAAAVLVHTHATSLRLVAEVQPVDAPLAVSQYVGTRLVDGAGIWLTMDSFGEGRDRAWLNLATNGRSGTWGDSAVIATLRPLGEGALASVAGLVMADRTAVGPGLGALPEA